MRDDDWTRGRLEDLTFMAATGEVPERAAERLGITFNNLEKWCERNHAKHLWAQLMANKHAPGHGARRGNIVKAIA